MALKLIKCSIEHFYALSDNIMRLTASLQFLKANGPISFAIVYEENQNPLKCTNTLKSQTFF